MIIQKSDYLKDLADPGIVFNLKPLMVGES